jgi:hypothetical protein
MVYLPGYQKCHALQSDPAGYEVLQGRCSQQVVTLAAKREVTNGIASSDEMSAPPISLT